MSTKTKFEICNLDIQTVKKNIKNMYLGVYPPNGRIRVAAPLKTSDEVIRLFVISKLSWIKKQHSKFVRQQRQTKREYVSGESHYFLGNRYRLNVVPINGLPKVEIRRKTHMDLYTRPNTSTKKREEILSNFYRSQLKKQIPSLVHKWEKITGVKVCQINIKKMKTKWGTSNPEYNRIWLNLELAKNNISCTEYVLAHEMTHFLEKNHSEKFYELMNAFLPQWQKYRDELNNSELGYFKWN